MSTLQRLQTAWIAAAFAAIVLMLMFTIYPCMDAFSNYHALACTYFPNAHCNPDLDLILPLPGDIHIPRNYPYIGSASAWYYFPFYLLYPHPISAYVCGLVALGLCMAAARRLTQCRYEVLLAVVFSNFFITFNFIQDQSCIPLQAIVMFAIPLALGRALKSPNPWRAQGWALLAALMTFIGVESKPLFVYTLFGLLPVTLVWCYQQIAPLGTNWRKTLRLLPACFLLAALLAILMLSKDNYGRTYIGSLLYQSRSMPLFSAQQADRLIWHWNTFFTRLGSAADFAYRYWTSPQELFGHTVTLYDKALSYAYWVILGVVVVLQLRYRAAMPRPYRAIQLSLIVGAALNMFIVSSSAALDHSHHVAPALLLMLLGCAMSAEALWRQNEKLVRALLCLLPLSQLGIAGYLSLSEPEPRATPDVWKALPVLQNKQLADNAMYIFSGWGTFYIYSLYGPRNQSFSPEYPGSPEQVQKLLDLAKSLGRSPVIISTPLFPPVQDYPATFPGVAQVYPPPGVKSSISIWADPEKWAQWHAQPPVSQVTE